MTRTTNHDECEPLFLMFFLHGISGIPVCNPTGLVQLTDFE